MLKCPSDGPPCRSDASCRFDDRVILSLCHSDPFSTRPPYYILITQKHLLYKNLKTLSLTTKKKSSTNFFLPNFFIARKYALVSLSRSLRQALNERMVLEERKRFIFSFSYLHTVLFFCLVYKLTK